MTQKQRICFGVGMWVIAAALLCAVTIDLPDWRKLVVVGGLACAYLGGVAFASYFDIKGEGRHTVDG